MPGTFSPWRTQDGTGGANRYWTNYNTETQYYGVYSANRPELAEPYDPVIRAALPYSRNRTHEAGYQGVTFTRTITPYAMTQPAPPTVPVAPTKDVGKLPSDQKTNGTFAVLPLLWNYEYTGDVNFFRTVTYPMLKELGAFWADFVEKDRTTGRYVVRHSAVNEGGDDVNSVYDLGFIRRTLTALIDGSKALGVDAQLRPGWQNVLDNLTPYPTAKMDGGGQETSGAIETVDSMMLQTYQGTTRVFPEWPQARDAKFVNLCAKGAFVLSSEQKHGRIGYVHVTSDRGNRFTLASPWGADPVAVVDGAGKAVAHTNAKGLISFPTTAGQTYHLTAGPGINSPGTKDRPGFVSPAHR